MQTLDADIHVTFHSQVSLDTKLCNVRFSSDEVATHTIMHA